MAGGAGGRVGEGDHEAGVAGELQCGGRGGGGGDDAALVAEGGQGVVDRVAQASAPGDGDVLGRRVPLGGHRLLGERVTRPDGEDESVTADEAVADVGQGRRAGTGREVDVAAAQLRGVVAGFGREAQPHPGGLAVHRGDEGRPAGGDEGVVPAHGEHLVQGGQVDFRAGGQQLVGLLHQGVDLGAHGQRPGGGGHVASGADQDLVAGGFADAAQRAAHRRCGDVEPGRGPGHAALLQQGVQGGEQIQIELHDGNRRSESHAFVVDGRGRGRPARPVTPCEGGDAGTRRRRSAPGTDASAVPARARSGGRTGGAPFFATRWPQPRRSAAQ